jgi:hypothetical protein
VTGHVTVNEPRLGDLLSGDLEHRVRRIEPDDLVVRLQLLEDRPGPARELENTLRFRVVLLDQQAQVRGVLRTVALNGIVKPSERLVAGHRDA